MVYVHCSSYLVHFLKSWMRHPFMAGEESNVQRTTLVSAWFTGWGEWFSYPEFPLPGLSRLTYIEVVLTYGKVPPYPLLRELVKLENPIHAHSDWEGSDGIRDCSLALNGSILYSQGPITVCIMLLQGPQCTVKQLSTSSWKPLQVSRQICFTTQLHWWK